MPKPEEFFTDALAASQVLSVRLPMLAFGMMAPTKASQAEQVRMVTEKMEAVTMGMVGLQAYWLKTAMTFWSQPMSQNAFQEAFTVAYEPARKAVRANAKRLSR